MLCYLNQHFQQLSINQLKMVIQTPASNIVIGTFYLLFLGIVAYITKRAVSLPSYEQNATKKYKYNTNNMSKALNNEKYTDLLQFPSIIIKSVCKKYSLIGTIFFNEDKLYLLKQILVISCICVACTVLNSIIVWPIAIIIPFVILHFLYLQFILRKQCKKLRVHQAERQQNNPIQFQIQPPIHRQQQVKEETKKAQTRHIKQIITITVASFLSFVLISQTMFMLYNSVSNLGVLNIGSVAIVFVLDQLVFRPLLTTILVTTVLAIHKMTNKPVFQFQLVLNLCEVELLKRIHEIQADFGTDEHFSMGVSPTKKKQISPTKIPKAPALYFQSETLMNLEITNRNNNNGTCQRIQQIEQLDQPNNNLSPIRDLKISKNSSIYLTSAQKQLFTHNENEQNLNKLVVQIQDEQKLRKNANQFYSIQRLPKDKQNTESLEQDGLILVQTGLNAFELQGKHNRNGKSNTLDVNFSPTKRGKRFTIPKKNKRQLVITGNSPYLEYLPDMMKKTGKQRKSLTPSQPQIASYSRKIL